MKIWKQGVLFYMGGLTYFCLELGWRRRSHGSMFLLGGLCFLLLGRLKRPKAPLPRAILGAALVTVLELGCGLLVNRNFQVWDYRRMPMNFRGQICLPFTALWILLSLVAFPLYRCLDTAIEKATSLFPHRDV